MKNSQPNPAWVAATIVLSIALIVILYKTDAVFFAPGPLEIREDYTGEAYGRLLQQYEIEYAIWVLTEDTEHYKWNIRSTKYIFWVSVVISMSGVGFAFWQFAQASQYDKLQSEHDEVEFKSHMASLSFRTRSIASFILLVSIVYLVIYVKFLYPVQHAPAVAVGATEPPPDDSSVGPAADGASDVVSDRPTLEAPTEPTER